MSGRNAWKWTGAGISLLALKALILFIVLPEAGTRLHRFYNADGYVDTYGQIAANLAAGNGYRVYPDTARTLSREPGYPVLLAGLFWIFGDTLIAAKLANMLFTFAAAGLIVILARRVSGSKTVILGAPLLFLFYPGTIVAESRGGVEAPFTFFLILFVLTMYRALETHAPFDYMVSGLALGATVLIRSTSICFPVVLLGYLLVLKRKESPLKLCRNIILMIVATLAILSPWVVRNYVLVRKFVPTATVLGISAHAGLYDNTHYSGSESWALVDRQGARERRKVAQELGYPFKPVANAYYQDFYSSQDEVKFSDYLLKTVIDDYKRSPKLFITCVGSNLFNFWFRGKTWASTMMNVVLQVPYLVLAMVGIAVATRNGQFKAVAPMVLLIVYTVAVSVVILAQARYSVPLIPFLSIFACITLACLQRKLRGMATKNCMTGTFRV
jgi:4-amino-4-deoxy-L-arabinose transferase-like glycosyltransferase